MAVARLGSPASEEKKLGCWPVGWLAPSPPKLLPLISGIRDLINKPIPLYPTCISR